MNSPAELKITTCTAPASRTAQMICSISSSGLNAFLSTRRNGGVAEANAAGQVGVGADFPPNVGVIVRVGVAVRVRVGVGVGDGGIAQGTQKTLSTYPHAQSTQTGSQRIRAVSVQPAYWPQMLTGPE